MGEGKFLSSLGGWTKVVKTYSREHGVAREELKADIVLGGANSKNKATRNLCTCADYIREYYLV